MYWPLPAPRAPALAERAHRPGEEPPSHRATTPPARDRAREGCAAEQDVTVVLKGRASCPKHPTWLLGEQPGGWEGSELRYRPSWANCTPGL